MKSERVPTPASLPPAYDVTVKTFGRRLTVRYEVLEAYAPRRLYLVAENNTLRLVDTITIAEADDGCFVTYEASLALRGALRLLDPLFAPGFRRTVDRGAAGLAAVLDGALV